MDSPSLVNPSSISAQNNISTETTPQAPEVVIPKSKNAPEACVICLCAVTERAITVPCNHYSFDFLCLASWLQERPACPLCNTKVTRIEYDWRSPEDYKTYHVPLAEETKSSQSSQSGYRSTTGGVSPLAQRRFPRARRVPRPTAPPQRPENAILRRRHVYRHNLYSLHVGSNRVSGYTNLTPTLVTRSEHLQSRARKWIRRELQVFEFLNSDSQDVQTQRIRRTNNAEFLLEYLIAILKTVDLRGSGGEAEDMVQEFLGREHARLFLHELSAWLRSPYERLEDWDRMVQYQEPLPVLFDEMGRGIKTEHTPARVPSQGPSERSTERLR